VRALGAARRERCFEPAFYEILEQRVAELDAAGSALGRALVRARFQKDALVLMLQSLCIVRAPDAPKLTRVPLGLPFLWTDLRLGARGLVRNPGSRSWSPPRSGSASAPTWRSSASSRECCCGRCRSPMPTG
jgi:hypothetical protein